MTLVSILVGLVLGDIVSVIRGTDIILGGSMDSIRFWIQVATAICATLIAWVAYSHIAMARQAIPSLWDTVNVFSFCGYLFFLNSTVGTRVYIWFYVVAGYVAMGWITTVMSVREAVKEPSLHEFGSLSSHRELHMILIYISLPIFLIGAVLSQYGIMPELAETLTMGFAIFAQLVWIILFYRRWRSAVRALDKD